MRDNFKTVFILCIVLSQYCYGLEYNNKRRLNENTDFLFHESGFPSLNPPPKHESNQKQANSKGVNTSYDSDFPLLNPSNKSPHTSTSTTKPTTAVWKNGPTSTSGKRDYVNPNYPNRPLPSTQVTNGGSLVNSPTTSPATLPTLSPKPTGKRDYVNPNYQNGSGKVKDLVNFYDSKKQDQTGTTKLPSFSSVLQGNKGSATTAAVGTTSRPGNTNKVPSQTTAKPTRPIVLPSSINSNNKNTQSNSNRPSDEEIQTLSEELLRKDVNNAAKYVTINYQERTTSQSNEDKAPLPLLSVSPEVWNIPTIQKFVPLLDNYERDTLVNEYITPQERNEENAFMDAIMSTTVIRHLMNFLKEKGYVTPDARQQRDFLKQLWFTLYSRGKGKLSSSSFEHVFVSELKNGEVMGLHNWIYFYKEEAARHANYLGYMKYLPFSDKGAVIKLHFSQGGINKPVNTMFLGTSPELEIALYTLCFVTRADNDCRLRLGNKYVDMVTYTFRYRSKNYIGSAYPQI